MGVFWIVGGYVHFLKITRDLVTNVLSWAIRHNGAVVIDAGFIGD
jgi:hypothetical protein